MGATDAGKSVIHLRINMNRHFWIAMQTVDHFLLCIWRNIFIMASDMKHKRMFDITGFVQLVMDIDAIEADAGVAVGARSGQVSKKPAQTIPHCTNLAVTALYATK